MKKQEKEDEEELRGTTRNEDTRKRGTKRNKEDLRGTKKLENDRNEKNGEEKQRDADKH